jgi:hypothetical protein
MPEETAGKTQQTIASAIGSMSSSERNGSPANQTTAQRAAEERATRPPASVPPVLPEALKNGGKK